ncbi:MAG: hypothetical protein ACI4AD_03535 [Roseburia sp.]
MSITIKGAESNSVYPALSGTLTIKNIGDKRARIASMCQTKKTKTKQLNYNHREISGQLMRARKTQAAGVVLTRAKSRVATLQRCAASGDYDSKEVTNALAHARRMVRCAQLKVRNLKEEERERATHQRENTTEEERKRSEVKRRVGQKERQLKQKLVAEEVQQVQQEKQKRQQILQKRRMHRNQERSKINEADMKYWKAYAENRYGAGGSGYGADSGVIMELSTVAVGLSEAQMLAQAELAAKQLTQELETELSKDWETEIAVDTGGTKTMMQGVTLSAPGGGELPSTVDISI